MPEGRLLVSSVHALWDIPGELHSSNYCSLLHIIAEQNEKHYILIVSAGTTSQGTVRLIYGHASHGNTACVFPLKKLFDTYSTITNSLVHSNVC